MNKVLRYFFLLYGIVLVVLSCSTEKNTLINRTYHGMTARYNGYFNANELIRLAVSNYRTSLKEDYYSILSIDPLPNETDVIGLYSSIDTAISKCTKVIQNHSMPSNDRPSKKKAEYNHWIDENWTTIGIADYYRRDYEGAMKNFEFVKKFYSNDPTIYIADLWIAKTNIALGNYSQAYFSLENIEKEIEREELLNKEKESGVKKKDKSSKKDEIAKFPKKIRFDFEKTKADLAFKKNNLEEAIVHLENSVKYAKKQSDKARIHFILAQLYEETNKLSVAKDHYNKVLKYNTSYEMIFTAKIKRAFLGGDEKLKKDLLKMLRDAKNAEFKDQIYYALANMELQMGNKIKAKEYLTLSAFYSTTNTRQKGMSYEKLGNLSFSERNYVAAQKYYDSCVNVIDSKYPNAEGVKNKALKLSDLVKAVETYEYEDSVQKIVQLNEKDRVEFIENVIKKIKKDEETRKRLQAERLRELQKQSSSNQNNDVNGSKWYWNNAKNRSEGYDEFRKLWGVRENEDNWRRSEKTSTVILNEEIVDTTNQVITSEKKEEDTLTVERLMSRLPLTDSAIVESNARLLTALFNSGVIYKEQLMENQMAIKQFNAVLDRKVESNYNLLSSYQLYKMYSESEPAKAEIQKEYILNYYPNSDYANFLRDPEYFIKKKERDAIAEKDYLTLLNRYNRGLYSPVIAISDIVINTEKDNIYRAKYMLLKALSIGQINENKAEIVPVLELLIHEYPNTEEAAKANELLSILKNGVSQNLPVDFNSKSIYTYNDNATHWVLVFLGNEVSSNTERTKISEFNREFFSKSKLKTSSKVYGENQSVILIEEFDSDTQALKYISTFKKTRKHLLDLQKAKIILITRDNLKLLFETRKLQEYEDFMLEYY